MIFSSGSGWSGNGFQHGQLLGGRRVFSHRLRWYRDFLDSEGCPDFNLIRLRGRIVRE